MVTVDRAKPIRQSELCLSGFWVQHMMEYSNADAAGVQRGIDFMQSIYDNGWVATHGCSPSFRQRDAMEIEGTYQWATSGNMRGLFDPATGNQAVVPAMARVSKAKRMLVTFGVPRPYSTSRSSADYDFYPCRTDSYTKLGQFWVRVAQEAKNRGTPFHGAEHRQELKKQPNRNFGSGGGGQSEVDSYTAIYEAFKSWDPTFPFFGPHLALGGTQTLADRNRPLKWPWDVNFLIGWMQRVPGWDGVLLDYATTDMNAPDAAHGKGNPDLMATWISNWGLICSDFWELAEPYFGPNKARKLGFIEHYSMEVNLQNWVLYTDAQKASFQFACLCELALGGVSDVFDWQPEGSASGTTFQDFFGIFNKTATSPASSDTGKPNAKGQAIKVFHDLIPPGTPIFPVQSNDPRVYGIATDTQTAIVNLNSTPFVDTIEGKNTTIPPYALAIVPAIPKSPPAITISAIDLAVVKADLNECIRLAKDALTHLP